MYLRNKNLYILLTSLLLLGSCQDVRRPEAPDNLLDEETMVKVLTESYLMNAARSVANREVINKGIKLDSIIYNKFAIDSLQFARSNAYYSANLDTYKEIFLQVQENLVKEKTLRDTLYERYKKSQAAIRIQDSIDKAQLDSLRLKFPQISQDSLQKKLEILQLSEEEKIYKKINPGIGGAAAESTQDSLL